MSRENRRPHFLLNYGRQLGGVQKGSVRDAATYLQRTTLPSCELINSGDRVAAAENGRVRS
jgi:hypothetical protein